MTPPRGRRAFEWGQVCPPHGHRWTTELSSCPPPAPECPMHILVHFNASRRFDGFLPVIYRVDEALVVEAESGSEKACTVIFRVVALSM